VLWEEDLYFCDFHLDLQPNTFLGSAPCEVYRASLKIETEKYVDKFQMDKLIQKIQASRNVADPTLYGGALQDNTDLYYKANKLYSQSDVPDGPPKIFRMYGATAELDNRQFMSLGLQAPRNPEQEALNEYFNRQRTRDFAIAQSRMNVSEQLSKQAELMANNVIRDEMDRRAGIRRTVLEATGYTPAQIQQELAADALGGINQTAMDIRERQVQDAVNLYYSLNNIPLPVTTTGGVQGAIAATVPTVAAAQLPADDAEAAVATDMAGMDVPQFVFGGPSAGAAGGAADEDGDGAAGGDERADVEDFGYEAYGAESARLFSRTGTMGGEEYNGAGGAGNWTGPLPEEPRGAGLLGHVAVDPSVASTVENWSKDACAQYIIDNYIRNPATLKRNGQLRSKSVLKLNTIETLRAIVMEHMTQATRFSLANNQGIGGGK
jgi:hypothetical protein